MSNEKRSKKEACLKEIVKILNKYGCALEAKVEITARGNIPKVYVVEVVK